MKSPRYIIRGFEETSADNIYVNKLLDKRFEDYWMEIRTKNIKFIMPKEQIPAFIKACYAIFREMRYLKSEKVNQVRRIPELIPDVSKV